VVHDLQVIEDELAATVLGKAQELLHREQDVRSDAEVRHAGGRHDHLRPQPPQRVEQPVTVPIHQPLSPLARREPVSRLLA
jgi:hypothetical protein